MEEGLTFVPGQKGRERIMALRAAIDVSPWPEVSERAKKEFGEIFEQTGCRRWMENLEMEQEKPLRLSFLGRGVIDE
jgi:hypothetical protein